ncbi:DUF1059 domain-containing protein [Haloprofundus salinisoli]|uniref:DUF1059 domain-containing protein n=1 Tax=Haloprofundus salinisoli TaxID=2876193 RepID=UPI001CCB93A4|nr:DUF1059 domain-containing protein [Haloprofundus salinisoli]
MSYGYGCIVGDCLFDTTADTEDELVDEAHQHNEEHHPDLDVGEERIRADIETK